MIFDRLGRILQSFGFKYYYNFSSVDLYINTKEHEIGDIIDLSLPSCDVAHYKTYHSDILLGDYYDNMLIKLIK